MKTARHPAIAAVISRAMRRGINRNFNGVHLSGTIPHPDAPLPRIICANHPGWWDPAVFACLQHHLFPKQHGYGPVDAKALNRYPLLNRAGFIPLDPSDPASLKNFLLTARKVLKDGHILWMTVQGRFADPRTRPLDLQRGIAHLGRHIPRVHIIPLAMEYSFWAESRPEILLRFGDPLPTPIAQSTHALTQTLEQALTDTMNHLAEDVQSRSADRFTSLTYGRAGIGGLYDAIRRAKSWSQGRAFDPRHQTTSGT